jgi:hypothetical protein
LTINLNIFEGKFRYGINNLYGTGPGVHEVKSGFSPVTVVGIFLCIHAYESKEHHNKKNGKLFHNTDLIGLYN